MNSEINAFINKYVLKTYTKNLTIPEKQGIL